MRTDKAVKGYKGRPQLDVTFEGPGEGFTDAPKVDGWECFFVGRFSKDKVTYHYHKVEEPRDAD